DQTVRRRQLSGQRHRFAERRHDMRVRQQISERGSESLRSGGAWKICLRQHYVIEQALQWFDKASMILIAHHPTDKNYRAGRMRALGAREEVGQGRRGSGIMRAIQ